MSRAKTLPWVKVYADLPEHPKTQHLEALIGPSAFDATARALLWLAKWRPDGDLSKTPDVVIERAVRWHGEPGALVRAWIVAGFVGEDRVWHDWRREQAAHAEKAGRDAETKRVKREAERLRREGNDTDSAAAALSRRADGARHSGGRRADGTETARAPFSDLRSQISDHTHTSEARANEPAAKDVPYREAINGIRLPRRGRGVQGLAEDQARPKTADELLAHPTASGSLGEEWARMCPTLASASGLAGLRATVEAIMAHSSWRDWPWPTLAINRATTWLRDEERRAVEAATAQQRKRTADARAAQATTATGPPDTATLLGPNLRPGPSRPAPDDLWGDAPASEAPS